MLIDALNCTIFDGGLESGYLVLIISTDSNCPRNSQLPTHVSIVVNIVAPRIK